MQTEKFSNTLNELFAHYPDSILMVSLSDEILYANPAGRRLLCRLPDAQGYLPPVLRVLNGQNHPLSLRDIAGSELIMEIKCQHIVWLETHVKLLTLCDRTRAVLQQRKLEQLVYCDELTGLFNRRGLDKQVKRLQARADQLQQKLNVLFIDVNGLKQINDSLGHGTGDAALLETAEVVRRGFGDDAIKARIGGDEFAVFQLDDPQQSVHNSIETIQSMLNKLNQQSGRPYRLSLSIGMSQHYPGQVFDFQQLIKLADQNMYRAKAEVDVIPADSHRARSKSLYLVSVKDDDQSDSAIIYA